MTFSTVHPPMVTRRRRCGQPSLANRFSSWRRVSRARSIYPRQRERRWPAVCGSPSSRQTCERCLMMSRCLMTSEYCTLHHEHPQTSPTCLQQVKIWFQNRRTKWKKTENISNAEAAIIMKNKLGLGKHQESKANTVSQDTKIIFHGVPILHIFSRWL